jgi:Fe-S cluster assembly protein SufD
MSALLEQFGGGDAVARAEAWKYSRNALRALEQQDFAPSATDLALAPELVARFDWPETRKARLVFVNGELSVPHSTLASGNDGVVNLADGERVHGVFVNVAAAGPTRWQRRLSITLEHGRAEWIEQHLGDAGKDVLGALDAQVHVGAGATLSATMLGELPDSASLIARARATLAAGARLETTHALFGGRLQRFDVAVDLSAAKSAFVSRGVFAPRARQHVDVHLDVRHAARDTVSDVLWRGVADGRGRGILHGGITVAPGADGTDARLQTRNLLLSAQAEIDAQPVLEIFADEVRASHGATVGQLDELALFYLRSRGLPQATARHLLIAGFCRESLDAVADPALYARLESVLDRALGNARAAGP